MSNTADKEAYLKKKQELLEELKKRKKQRYEQRKKVIPKNEAEKELLEKTEKTLFKNLTLYAEGLKQGIEQFKQNERKAEAGLYSYNNLLYQLPKWFNDESTLFENQTEINFLQKKESMNLFAVILIGGILLTAGYYTLSFMSQSKKTK